MNNNDIFAGLVALFSSAIFVFLFILTVVLLILLFAGLLTLIIAITVRNKKHKEFAITQSVAIKNLREINNRYKFFKIENFDMKHSYDNVDFYNDITCQDYLIYELVYIKNKVDKNIDNALENRDRFKRYKEEVKKISVFGKYNQDIGKFKIDKLIKYERQAFNGRLQSPRTNFGIYVRLIRTNINDVYQESKSREFSIPEIWDLIDKINDKRGNFYRNQDIWNAICRVERGKVSNKLRFFIYDRDHNRCRKCGSRLNLEVDHIIPIAKGGKTTPDNLQTLCQRCNKAKGASLPY